MKKKLLVIILILIIMITGCNTNTTNKDNECLDPITCNAVLDTESNKNEIVTIIDKLEIYHFHGTNQCYSCITVGDYAEETVKTYFKKEVDEGLIVFDHINAELPENRELVIKYGATGSSIWLGTYKGKDFNAEQNTQVWYKISNKQDYMNYLKHEIEQKLQGI